MKIDMKADNFGKIAVKMNDNSKASRKALRSTVNKLTKSTRAYGIKELRGKYNIKASSARKSIKYSSASLSNIAASLEATKKNISLIAFKARQNKKGVGYAVSKGGSRRIIEGGFIANMKNKGSGDPTGKAVFKRRGRKRLPIIKQTGPSMAQLFLSNNMINVMEGYITRNFEDVFRREYEYYTN